jgi:hypothetical protein
MKNIVSSLAVLLICSVMLGALPSGSSAMGAVKKSLVVGIDGMGSLGLRAATTPNMDALMSGAFGGGDYRGAFTPNAFTGGTIGTPTQQVTSSGPSWSTILTGVWTDKHRVTDNSFSGRDFNNNPTYLETLEENVGGINSIGIVNWSPIDTYVITSVNDADSLMDLRSTPGNDSNVTLVAAARIAGLAAEDPAAIFIQYDEVDGAPTALTHFEMAVPANIAGQARGQSVLPAIAPSLAGGLVSHITFDGYVVLDDDLAGTFGAGGDFSVSFWLKFDSFSSDPAFFSNKNWASGSNTGINLAFNPDNTLDFNTKADAGDRKDVHPFGQLLPGRWQNVVFTVDRDAATTVYLDGTPVGSIGGTSQGSFDGAFNWTLLNDGTGSYAYSSTAAGLMVDEFAAWNRILSLDEISTLSTVALSSALASPGDANRDGKVTDADATILATNWQTGAGTTSTPEPSTAVILLGLLAGITVSSPLKNHLVGRSSR